MREAQILAELWRGNLLESVHRGHAVICSANGDILASWGDPDRIIYPRSSCKMLQALPLIESGAADAYALTPEHLALSCASHQGAPMHSDRVGDWLNMLGLAEPDLRCGPQPPAHADDRQALRDAGEPPCQLHNNCSGKHAGFLTLGKHWNSGPEYVEITHPVQQAVKSAFEEMTEETSPGFGIDGCSAPNFACSLKGLALAAAKMGAPVTSMGATRSKAAARLVSAMKQHPLLVAGEGRACSELMAAMQTPTVLKTGAEAVFVAILPHRGLGIALKVEDGATRGSESALAALLVRLGELDADNPIVQKRLSPIEVNRRGIAAARIRPAEDFYCNGAKL